MALDLPRAAWLGLLLRFSSWYLPSARAEIVVLGGIAALLVIFVEPPGRASAVFSMLALTLRLASVCGHARRFASVWPIRSLAWLRPWQAERRLRQRASETKSSEPIWHAHNLY
jgi:hypothetical protein